MLRKRISSQENSQGEFETTQGSRTGMEVVIKGVIFFGREMRVMILALAADVGRE